VRNAGHVRGSRPRMRAECGMVTKWGGTGGGERRAVLEGLSGHSKGGREAGREEGGAPPSRPQCARYSLFAGGAPSPFTQWRVPITQEIGNNHPAPRTPATKHQTRVLGSKP
jgi:hypothetical protein